MNSTALQLSTSTQSSWTRMVSNSTPYPDSSLNGPENDEPHTTPLYDYDEYYSKGVDPSAIVCNYGVHASNILPVLYSLFFVLGLLGNLLVLWVMLMGVRLKSMTDICLLNLALADLLLVSSLPFLAHYARDQWVFGGPMCTMVLGVYHIGFYSGIFFIVLMSVDRYLAVVHSVFALRVKAKIYGILASVVIWIIAVAASFPELMYLKTYENNNKTYCQSYPTDDQKSHHYGKTVGIIKMNVLGLFIPLCVIGFCYSMILHRLLTVRFSRKQAMRLVIVVMVAFFCCWAPYNIAAFVRALELNELLKTSCEKSKAITLSLQITEALAYSHSGLNPILYVFVGEKFRKHLFRLLYKTPISRLQFTKRYLTQATGSVYSQTTSLDDKSIAMRSEI
ncbi:C-C chemokine receptor type 5-like [Misgurnus anguillicaudatus]|uniref:C-C chemokine receptor type 5-like n=1 Tax=Misgurnus anguillicaudatus TaxID=75329 RepID=UPI003CCFCD8C